MPLAFTKQVQGQLCDPGESAQFSCATDISVSGLTATWLRDNKPLDDSMADRVEITAKENHFTLKMNKVQAGDSGQITCRITNASGEAAATSANLEVHQLTPAEKKEREESNHPIFLVKLRDSELLLDSAASLMVHVKGNPNPEVQVLKDGAPLNEDGRVTVNRDAAPHGSYEIVINKVQAGDAGNYSVKATNGVGAAECSAAVNVKDAKDVFALLQGRERKVAPGEEPTFTWFRAGQEFDPEDRFKVLFKDEEDTLALVFQHINPEDAGLYTCVASTSTGKISCSAELSVEGGVTQLLKEPEPPKIIGALGDVDSSVGGSAIMEFKMKGYPRPNIKWTKDGKPIEAGGRFKFVNPDVETVALIINKIEPEDAGDYQVVLSNDLGEAKTQGKLTLSGAPQFKEKIEDQKTGIDDAHKILAKVTGNPQLTWYKNGVPIKEDSRIKSVKIDAETFALQFTRCDADDNGNWAVIAKNGHGEMSQFFTFSAQMLPKFETKLSDVEANEGKQVVLKCKIACIPPPQVQWFKGDTEITKDSRVKCYKDPNGYDCLQISSASRSMKGEFTVKATNDMGTAKSSCNVKVNTKPSCDDLDDIEAIENDVLVVAVNCDGDPKPVVKWTKDGKAFDSKDDRIKVTESSGLYSVTIQPCSMDDKGKYKAEFTNRAGEAKVECSVNVISQEELKVPKFLTDLKDKKGNKGGKTFFNVKVRGDPVPEVKWFLKGEEISANTDRIQLSEKDFVYRMDISDLNSDLVGEIKVVATNENGSDERKGNLDVLFQPEIDAMSEYKAGPGDTAQISVKVTASPDADITWAKAGSGEGAKMEKIDFGAKRDKKWARFSTSSEKDGVCETHFLVIKDCVMEDAGSIQVKAKNRIGESESTSAFTVVTEPPCFPVPLKDITTKLGATETFEVVVGGVPKPEVAWFRGDKELKKGKRILMEEEAGEAGQVKYKMTVRDIDLKDFGDIILKATNLAGEVSNQCVFQIIPIKPSIEADFPKMSEVKEGGEFVLTAKVDGSPPPTAIWLCEGEPVKADGERVIITEEESPDGQGIITTLRIVAAADEDMGKYTLLVKNSAGETQMDSLLDVMGKPKAPKVVKEIEPKEMTIPGNRNLKLQCKISGFPVPQIKWLRDGNEIKVRKGVLVSQDANGGATLVVEKAQISDAGRYTAVGTNEVGKAETSADVQVTQPMEEPKFTSMLRSAKAVEGSPVKLEGKVTGHPMPTITWLKNEKEFIPDGNRVKAFMNDDGTFGLVFESTEGDDKGSYTAVAANDEGTAARTTANVAIKTRLKEGVEKSLPSFGRPLGDVAVDEGQKLRITTPVKGNPVPTFSWTKDGKPLDSDRVHFFSDGELIGLEIRDAKTDDAGKYECHLANDQGKCTGECNVQVYKIFKPPHFSRQLSDLQQLANCDARFVCEVGCNPKPEISWYHNGKPIQDGGRYKIKNNGNSRMLIIKKLQDSDGGEIKCVAKNKEGQAESRANLEIVEFVERKRTDAPEFLKKIGDELVFRGMSARFTALVTGNPEPEFEFTLNGKPLFATDRIHMSRERTGLIRLSMAYVEESDIGTYGLRVWNEHGSSYCEAKLKYDGLEIYPDQALGDLYQGFDKYSVSGLPMPLPDKPLVTGMSDTSVTLTWKPAIPLGPNLAPYYMVEMAEYPDGDWIEVYEEVRGICCDINGLTPLRDYRFRVSVRNRFGLSDPSPYCVAHRSNFSRDPVVSEPFLAPGQPFDLSTSMKFPKGFDIYKEPYEGYVHPPRFLKQNEITQYGVKNSCPELTWNLYGFPMPDVSFKFEGKDVDMTNGKYNYTYSRNGVVSLRIDCFTSADVGTYECVGRNPHGEMTQPMIMALAQYPEFIRAPAEVNLIGVNGGKIECQVFGVPKPEVVWYKDYHPFRETCRVQTHFYSPDVHTLFFNDYITKDEGLYTVVASNLCGSISHSVIVRILEDEQEFAWMTYRRTKQVIPKTRGYEKFYHTCEEIGRGTQGITNFVQQIMPIEADQSGHHAIEEADSKYWWLHRGVKEHAPTIDPVMIPYRFTGGNFAAKNMHGTGKFKNWMVNEFEMMNVLHHPKLTRLIDCYDARDEMTLISELCTGGELLEKVTSQKYITEIEVARIVIQVLEGLEYMHSKGIGHLGLTPCDVLFTRPGGAEVKISDFSLAHRIVGSVKLEYGQPEFVAPEIVNMEGAGFGSDMWSVGIITYLLLSGVSPFRGQNDRETLQRIQMGDIDFDFELWQNISREAKHFVANLLVYKPEERMSVRQALSHPWLQVLKMPGIEISEQYQISTERLRNYYGTLKEWYANAQCEYLYRRRPLAGAFTHPSCMVYPPGEPDPVQAEATPPPVGAPSTDDWERASYTIGEFENPSNYQNGPDTYLLQVKDPDFPARLREYLSVARTTSAQFQDVKCPIIKERRRFTDVMEEEAERQRDARLEAYDYARTETVTQITIEKEVIDGVAPFVREKPQSIALSEGEPLELTALVSGDPKPAIQWLKNDLVFTDDSRLQINNDCEDGRSRLVLDPAMPSDAGLYKVVARNPLGMATASFRVVLGDIPDSPDSPMVEAMTDTDILLSWKTPAKLNHSPVICYKVQMGYIDTDIDWVDLADDIRHEYFVIDNLRPSHGYKFRVAAMNKFGWSIPSIPSPIAMTPSSGASKAEFYDALQTLQAREDINLDAEEPVISYEVERKPLKAKTEIPKDLDFMSELNKGQFTLMCNINHGGKVATAKIFDKSDADGDDAAKREFKNLKAIRHEKIVTLIDSFEDSKTSMLLFEPLPGTDVLTYLAERSAGYSEQLVADIACQTLDALSYLNWRGKVYLNLEPGHIIVCSGRSLGKTLKVKLINLETTQTVSNSGTQIKGTYNFDYSAPEILDEAKAFPQSDIWSLGVLLYVLLSGQLPFKGENSEDTKSNILNVRFKFEWLYNEVTMEATRLLMWIFKRAPWKRPSIEETANHRWMSPSDYMSRKRERAAFPVNRIRKFASEYHASRPQMNMDAASFFSKMAN